MCGMTRAIPVRGLAETGPRPTPATPPLASSRRANIIPVAWPGPGVREAWLVVADDVVVGGGVIGLGQTHCPSVFFSLRRLPLLFF